MFGSSRFLFTVAPLDYELSSVSVSDVTSGESTVQLLQQYGLHVLPLTDYRAPLWIRFSLPSVLPTTNVVTGVGCFENAATSEVTCRYLPRIDLSPPQFHTSVVQLDAEMGTYALYFKLPYLPRSTDADSPYSAMIAWNGIFTVNTTEVPCTSDSTDTYLQCSLVVTPSSSNDTSLPYEAYLPLSTYSYARASIATPQSLITLSFTITDTTPLASMLDYIAQYAHIDMDANDSQLFSLSSLDVTKSPSSIVYPDETAAATTFQMTSPDMNFTANAPPAQPMFVRALLGVFDLNTVENNAHKIFPAEAIVGVLLVAGEQGFRKRDTLRLTVNVDLQADDIFLSDYADCVPIFPRSITCVVLKTVPRDETGSSVFAVNSKAFERVNALSVSVTHLVPSAMSMSENPGLDVVTTSMAVNETELETHFQAFENIAIMSTPRPPEYDMSLDDFIYSPYYDGSVSNFLPATTNILSNQYITVEVGCLLEGYYLSANYNSCTRMYNRVFRCDFNYGLADALNANPFTLMIRPFTWHEDINYRVSPVALKRVLADDPRIALETRSIPIHMTQPFSFRVTNAAAAITHTNATLTADLFAEGAPRLLYPSVDRFVFNGTAPLFEDISGEAVTITGAFTPRVEVTAEATDGSSDVIKSWELDTAAAVPLECFSLSLYAVLCLLTAETGATRGQITITVAYSQLRIKDHNITVSMSIYTSTDINDCGGYNPVEAASTITPDTKSKQTKASVGSSSSDRFVTAAADIAAARRHTRRLAKQWSARQAKQASLLRVTNSASLLNAAVTDTEDMLPPEWKLAYMYTTADVAVTLSGHNTASTGTFWAFTPAVVWLWPVLGVMLLSFIAYRIWKYQQRKLAKTHPYNSTSVKTVEGCKEAFSEYGIDACVQMAEMTPGIVAAETYEKASSTVTMEPVQSLENTSHSESQYESPSFIAHSESTEHLQFDALDDNDSHSRISVSATVIDIQCGSEDAHTPTTQLGSGTSIATLYPDGMSMPASSSPSSRDARNTYHYVEPHISRQPVPTMPSKRACGSASSLPPTAPWAYELVSADSMTTRSAHTDFIEAYSFSTKSSSEMSFNFLTLQYLVDTTSVSSLENTNPSFGGDFAVHSRFGTPDYRPVADQHLIAPSPLAAGAPVVQDSTSPDISSKLDVVNGLKEESSDAFNVTPMLPPLQLWKQSSFHSLPLEDLSARSSYYSALDSYRSGLDLVYERSRSPKAHYINLENAITLLRLPSSATDISMSSCHYSSPSQPTVSNASSNPEALVTNSYHLPTEDEIKLKAPLENEAVPALVRIHDFLHPAFVMPPVPLEHYARVAPPPMVVLPPSPFQPTDVAYDPFAQHKLMVIRDTAVRLYPDVPVYKAYRKPAQYRAVSNVLDVCSHPPVLVAQSTNPYAQVYAEDYHSIFAQEDLISSPMVSQRDSMMNSETMSYDRNSFTCTSTSSLRNDIAQIIRYAEPSSHNNGLAFRAPPAKLFEPGVYKQQLDGASTTPFPLPPADMLPPSMNPVEQAKYAAWLGVTGYQLYQCEPAPEADQGPLDDVVSQRPPSVLEDKSS